MIKDIFILKKNSWYMWLMKWIWGWDHYDFSHMCPVFWLTIANVIIFVPFSFFKLIVLGFVSVINYLCEIAEERSNLKWNAKQNNIKNKVELLKNNKNELLKFLERLEAKEAFGTCIPKDYNDIYQSLRYYGDNQAMSIERRKIREVNEKILEDRAKIQFEKDKLKREEMIRVKTKIAKITKIVKPIGTVILYIFFAFIVFVISYYAYKLFNIVKLGINNSKHKNWVEFGTDVLRVIIGTAVICIIIFILVYICMFIQENVSISCKTKARFKHILYILLYLKYIFYPMIWLCKGIYIILCMVIQIIKNQCPAVKWE